MSFDEFISYLKNATNDHDFISLVEELDSLLVNYNLNDYLIQIANIVYSNSQEDDSDVVIKVKFFLNDILDYILNTHGIVLNDETMLKEKLNLCLGLNELESYLDKQKLLDILSSDNTTEEKLSEIMSLVTEYDIEKLLTLFLSVSDSLLNKIRDNITIIDDSEDIDISKYVTRYSKFKQSINNLEVYPDRFISNINIIGLPFKLYLNLYIAYIKELETLDVKTVSLDLVGMCLLASNEEVVSNIIKDNISLISTELEFISKVNMNVTEILNEMVKNG